LFGAVAAGAEAAIAAFNLQERAVVAGMFSERMARELRDFELDFGIYTAADDPIETLHSKIEHLRHEASSSRFRLDRATERMNVQPKSEPESG
jgi:hypothetical protein